MSDEIEIRRSKAAAAPRINGTHLLLIICIFALALAAAGHWPYSFYVLLRFLICASSVFLASRNFKNRRHVYGWIFGAVAVLFNPVFPIRMARSDWQLINILTTIFFGGYLIAAMAIREKSSQRYASIAGKAKSILYSVGALGGIALYLLLVVGILFVFFRVLPILAAIANILAAISLLLVVPFLLLPLMFKRTRHFSGNGLVVLSYILGISTWLTATIWLADLWGRTAVVLGVLMFGAGSVPLALLALLFHAHFALFFILIAQLAAVYIFRVLGIWIESKAPPTPFESGPNLLAKTVEDWLSEGRGYYDLAEPDKWNPAHAASCFLKGLRVDPDNAELHHYLGMLYEDGDGVPKDPTEAFKHFSAAAELGDSSGQRALGEMYDEGIGVDKDPRAAAMWYQRAAEQGDSYAQCRLGFFYLNGIGVEKDSAQALVWYVKAAGAGEASAQLALGELYAKGSGLCEGDAPS